MEFFLLPVALAICYVGLQIRARNKLKIIDMKLKAKLAGWSDEQWRAFADADHSVDA